MTLSRRSSSGLTPVGPVEAGLAHPSPVHPQHRFLRFESTGVAPRPEEPPEPAHLLRSVLGSIWDAPGLRGRKEAVFRPGGGFEFGVAVIDEPGEVLRAIGPDVLGAAPGPGFVGGDQVGTSASERLRQAARQRGHLRSRMAVCWVGGTPLGKARHSEALLPPFASKPVACSPRGAGVRARGVAFVVAEKAADVLSVPGRGPHAPPCLQDHLRRLLAAPHLTMAHRLDMATSGLMVAALEPRALAHLHRQFRERRVHKAYEALLVGAVNPDQGVIRLHTRLDVAERPRQIYDPIHGKYGETAFRVLERSPRWTRVRFVPKTGRTHQIRVHAAHPLGLGAPILGDRLYGIGAAGDRLHLHAIELAFDDPDSGWPVFISSQAPF